MVEPDDLERRIEALLFAAAAPLSVEEIARRLPEGADVGGTLTALIERYKGRGVELECVAGRWRFRTAPDLAFLMTEEREEHRRYTPTQRVEAFALEEARDWLREVMPKLADWTPLDKVAPSADYRRAGPTQASYVASTLSASLELVKEGAMDVKQTKAFDDLYLRRRDIGQPLELIP